MEPPISGPTRFEMHERCKWLFEPKKGIGHYYLPSVRYQFSFDHFPWNNHSYVCTGFDPYGPRMLLTQEVLDSYGQQLQKGRIGGTVSPIMLALGYDGPEQLHGDDFLVALWYLPQGSDLTHAITCQTWNAALADSNVDEMRLQAFGHAMQTGARFIVITDEDTYEIHDRTKGLNFESTMCGSFQLTRSTIGALDLLNLIGSKEPR
jgi:hypothetical protein